MSIDGGMNLGKNLLCGTFMFHGVVDSIVGVVSGKILDKRVHCVMQASGGLVPVHGYRALIHSHEYLHGRMHRVLRVPIDVDTGDKRQEAGAGKGVVARVGGWVALGAWQVGSSVFFPHQCAEAPKSVQPS